MKIYHKKPCKDCPWRKDSPKGYLGGHDPNFYADAITYGEIPACHLKDYGPDSDETAFCAGAASVMANSCKVPFKQEGAAEMVKRSVRMKTLFLTKHYFTNTTLMKIIHSHL